MIEVRGRDGSAKCVCGEVLLQAVSPVDRHRYKFCVKCDAHNHRTNPKLAAEPPAEPTPGFVSEEP